MLQRGSTPGRDERGWPGNKYTGNKICKKMKNKMKFSYVNWQSHGQWKLNGVVLALQANEVCVCVCVCVCVPKQLGLSPTCVSLLENVQE